MKLPEFKPSYDVVIIGAGVAGLTAAALLGKAGLKVCVLEKEPHPGGYLAGFRRKDFRFDTAIHWLNQCDEHGMVNQAFRILGDDFPHAKQQKRIRRFLGTGYDYLLTDHPDELKKQWQAEFPQDTAGIERFFKDARRIAKAFREFSDVFRTEESMHLLERLLSKHKLGKFALAFLPFIRYSGEKGMKKGLARYFTAEKFSKIFASDSELLSCLIPVAWAYNKDFQLPPVGGGQRIPEWLEHVARQHHVDIAYQSRVDQVLVAQHTCTGVHFVCQKKSYQINANYVIAACDIELLYERLLTPDLIPQKLKDKLKKAELYSSSVTLNIALDCCPSVLGFDEEFIQIAGKPSYHSDTTSHTAADAEISILAPSLRDPSLAPKGKGTLTIYMPAEMHFMDGWLTASGEQGDPERGAAYIALKEQLASDLIDRVAAWVAPNLREHILFYEVATPVTHWRYTGNRNGSIMGAKPGRANMMNGIAHYQTPVKHLLIGGHWAELGGGVPIAVKAATNAALLVLQQLRPQQAKSLARYMDRKIDVAQLKAVPGWLPCPNDWQPEPTPAIKTEERLKAKLKAEGEQGDTSQK